MKPKTETETTSETETETKTIWNVIKEKIRGFKTSEKTTKPEESTDFYINNRETIKELKNDVITFFYLKNRFEGSKDKKQLINQYSNIIRIKTNIDRNINKLIKKDEISLQETADLKALKEKIESIKLTKNQKLAEKTPEYRKETIKPKIDRLLQKISKKNGLIKNLDEIIAEQEKTIKEQENRLNDKIELIETYKTRIKELDKRNQKLKSKIGKKDGVIQSKNQTITQIKKKNQHIQKLRKDLHDKHSKYKTKALKLAYLQS